MQHCLKVEKAIEAGDVWLKPIAFWVCLSGCLFYAYLLMVTLPDLTEVVRFSSPCCMQCVVHLVFCCHILRSLYGAQHCSPSRGFWGEFRVCFCAGLSHLFYLSEAWLTDSCSVCCGEQGAELKGKALFCRSWDLGHDRKDEIAGKSPALRDRVRNTVTKEKLGVELLLLHPKGSQVTFVFSVSWIGLGVVQNGKALAAKGQTKCFFCRETKRRQI